MLPISTLEKSKRSQGVETPLETLKNPEISLTSNVDNGAIDLMAFNLLTMEPTHSCPGSCRI